MSYHGSSLFAHALERPALAYGARGGLREITLYRKPLYETPEARQRLLAREERVDLGSVRCAALAGIPVTSAAEIGVDAVHELVFDVDASDYDRTGVCACDAHRACAVCWRELLMPAARELSARVARLLALSAQQQVHLWFSGARGFHAWVTDPRAVVLPRGARAYIVQRTAPVRLDAAATRSPTHLLRCPLSMHQRTKNIVVPLDLREPRVPLPHATYPKNTAMLERHADEAMLRMWPAHYDHFTF